MWSALSVAVIGGTGDEGFGLSLRLARAGEDVVIGSRAEDRGQAAAQKAADILGLGSGSGTRGGIEGTSNEKAAAACDIVFVTVPYAGQAEIYRSIKDRIPAGRIVVDTTTPLATAAGTRSALPMTSSAAEAISSAMAMVVTLSSTPKWSAEPR